MIMFAHLNRGFSGTWIHPGRMLKRKRVVNYPGKIRLDKNSGLVPKIQRSFNFAVVQSRARICVPVAIEIAIVIASVRSMA